jgi:fatty-acyl-CoA synthase
MMRPERVLVERPMTFVEDLDVRTPADLERVEATPLEERVPCRTTYELIAAVADAQPERPAIHWLPAGAPSSADRVVSYGEFICSVMQMANFIRMRGLTCTSVLAYLLPNLPETHYVLAGTQAAAIVMPLNPLLDSEHLATMLALAGAKMLVAARGRAFGALEQKARAIARALPGLEIVFVDTEDVRPDGLLAKLDEQPSERLCLGMSRGMLKIGERRCSP